MTGRILSVLFALLYSVAAIQVKSNWVINSLERAVDVRSSYAKVRYELIAENFGSVPSDEFVIALPSGFAKKAAVIAPVLRSPKTASSALLNDTVIQPDNALPNVNYYMLKIGAPIAPKSSIALSLTMISTHQLHPVPESAPMSESQSITLDTIRYPVSPYAIKQYAVIFVGTENGKMKWDSELPDPLDLDFTTKEDKIFTEPTKGTIPPNTYIPMKVEFTKKGFISDVSYLKRECWVSHWGNAYETRDYYELTNAGAKLSEGFNRAKWMSHGLANKLTPAITSIQFLLPQEEVSDIYYTDKVGNVSTSRVASNRLILHPRYPIMGGWHYNFTVGWKSSLTNFLKTVGPSTYLVNFKILGGLVDSIYDNVDLSIILPEGAEVLDVSAPYEYSDLEISNIYSYLDVTTGRTVVSLNYKNLISDQMETEIYVKYRYTYAELIKKPLTTSLYVFLALFAMYILRKVNMSIKPAENTSKKQ